MRLLLGPAGSGKTFRCLTEIRRALIASPEGAPLLLVAPKQTTYQLERQFLAFPSIAGYTRLHILSFERLAYFVFDRLGMRAPEMLDEEGRLMVLRGLLSRRRDGLKLFRASARLTGFAQQLSEVLRELQRNQLTPEALNQLAQQVQEVEGLAYKLQDLATLLQDYLDWLKAHNLQDADCLLAAATEALGVVQSPESRVQSLKSEVRSPKSGIGSQESFSSTETGGESRTRTNEMAAKEPSILHRPSSLSSPLLWVDGFAELSEQEQDFLAALMPWCQEAAVTFCLERVPSKKGTWLSNWSVARKTFEDCRKRLASLAGAEVRVELTARHPNKSRFLNNPVLQHLESCWAEPKPYQAAMGAEQRTLNLEVPRVEGRGSRVEVRGTSGEGRVAEEVGESLRVAVCADMEAEVKLAAREVLRYAREGGRYRDVTVLVRKLEGYHQPLQREFSRYGIPFFLDRRESVSHHPLAELTRSALRTVVSQWLRDDWFAALKTGLVPADEVEIDKLENEALARGWKGEVWQKPIVIPGEPELTAWLADLHQRLLPPFHRLALALAVCENKPTGMQLAAALRQIWQGLGVEQRLQEWAAAEVSSGEFRIPNSVHATVWEQMNAWLCNIELAFPKEPLPLREWLPILEAGLAGLTVGVIPPALDQVLIGAIDRSRNPDIKLALVLGLNETVFPAPPERTVLLTDSDRVELEKRNVKVGGTARQQLARERYYAYIACTRARQRVVLTCAMQDGRGAPLNPSPFLSQVRQLFPSLQIESVAKTLDWRESEHVTELIGPLLKVQSPESKVQSPKSIVSGQWSVVSSDASKKVAEDATRNTQHERRTTDHGLLTTDCSAITTLPALAELLEELRHFRNPQLEEGLAPGLAERLYGPVLRTSVSRMEQFAACPFKFFIHSGLRAQERKLFELDVKEQGTFQHDVLALFHEHLRHENKRWRDITAFEARERVGRIAKGLMASYRDGLLEASEETRFMARILSESLQDFVETLVGWMREQYRFDPVAVELPFGEGDGAPAWALEMGGGRRLELYGRIDRVDLSREGGMDGEALCVVVDYKSSQKQLDPVLMAHGLQLQLLTYLNVLRSWPKPREFFGVGRLAPAGVFYVNLRGKYDREQNRQDALGDAEQARKLAYRHAGRFDTRALSQLDGRAGARQGDQFNYRLTKEGRVYKSSREAMGSAEFRVLLDSVAKNLKAMGRQIYEGVAEVAPYRKGTVTACEQCSYRAICRIDPWTHRYRVLREEDQAIAKT